MCLGGGGSSYQEPEMQKPLDWDYSAQQAQKVDKVNEDWTTETDGGTFECDGEEVEMKPGRFVLFNPRKPHRAGKVLSNKKRLALDLAVNPSPYYNMNYG